MCSRENDGIYQDWQKPQYPRRGAGAWLLAYYFGFGGKSFNNFSMALSKRSWFFSGLLVGFIVFPALPVQTSFLFDGSYISRTSVPTSIVELVAVAIPPPQPQPPPVP